MSDDLSIKIDFKTRILKKGHAHYPLAIGVSEEEFGCDIFASSLVNLLPSDPLRKKASSRRHKESIGMEMCCENLHAYS